MVFIQNKIYTNHNKNHFRPCRGLQEDEEWLGKLLQTPPNRITLDPTTFFFFYRR